MSVFWDTLTSVHLPHYDTGGGLAVRWVNNQFDVWDSSPHVLRLTWSPPWSPEYATEVIQGILRWETTRWYPDVVIAHCFQPETALVQLAVGHTMLPEAPTEGAPLWYLGQLTLGTVSAPEPRVGRYRQILEDT